MQSIVILFCAVLFCSQIVDSISRRESRPRYIENSPPNWQVDQNAQTAQNWQVDQNAQNADYNDYTPKRNVKTLPNPAIDQEISQNYYSDKGLYDGGRLVNSPIVESYPSQVILDNHQFRKNNWRPQSQFNNFASNSVPIPIDNGSPSVSTVQEPYESPLQYFASRNRQDYQPDRSYLARNPFKYPTADNAGDRFDANSGFGSSGQERPYENYMTRSDLSSPAHSSNYGDNSNYNLDSSSNSNSENYNEGIALASQIKAKLNRHANRLPSQTGKNYNEPPAGIGTGALENRSGNIYSKDSSSNDDSESYNEGIALASQTKAKLNRHANRLVSQTGKNYNEPPADIGNLGTLENRSGNIFSNTAPIIHYDDELIAATDNYSKRSRPGNGPVPYEIIDEDQAAAPKAKPRPIGGRRQKNPTHVNIGKQAVISNILSDTSLARRNARNMDDSYDGIPTGIKEQSGNYEYRSGGFSPSNTDLNHNIYQKALGIKDIKLNKLVTQPEMQKMLSESDSRFLIIHPNGTVENVDKIDLDSQQNSLRLVNTKHNYVADTEGDGTQSPDNVQNNIAKTSVPKDESPLPTNKQPAHVNQTNPAEESNSKLPIKDLPGDQSNLNMLTPLVNQPGEVNDTNSSSPREIKPAVDKTILPSNENQLVDYNTFKQLYPHTRHQTRRNKLKHPHGIQLKNDNDSRPSSPNEKQPSGDNNAQLLPSKEEQSTVRRTHRTHHAHSKSKSSNGNPPAEGNDSSPSNADQNQLSDAKNSKPLPSKENQSEHDSNVKPSGESQQGDGNKSKPLNSLKRKWNHHIKSKPLPVNQSADDDTSPENKLGANNNPDLWSDDENQAHDENQTEGENRPEDDKTSKPLRPYEKQSTGDSKPTLPGVSKTDEQSDSTTFSATASNETTSPKPKKHTYRHQHQQPTTSSPIVYTTTPSSEKTSEDQIITLSPIEQVTDNVSDVQPVTTTTTTAKPIETLGKTDTTKYANNNQDDDQEDASSSSEDLETLDKLQKTATTESPSSSTTPTDITTDDKTTKETPESKDTQTNDKAIKSQGNNGKNDIQTVQSAVYDSSELLDTNTDVPAESDDYSPVTTSPSVHNDVDSGDASGDNTLELEQPETDVTITVSSSKANDSEDEIITINIEISESTGLSGKNKTLVVSIDTDNDDNDDAKTPKSSGSGSQSSDCNKDHDDGRGKNLEIDMSNIQGEPTLWIRTTNQDFIDKLTDKNDTSFDIVYFFNNVNQPAIERVKETTIHCNGTVVIESKDITYANKDDPTPTITKTTQTIQIEDYKRFGLDLS